MSAASKLLVRAAAESQTGNARGNNEDNVYFNGDFISPRAIRKDFAMKTGEYSESNCFAVFDGMGRNNTGSYASLLAASRLDDVADRVAYDIGRDADSVVLEYVRSTNIEIREQIKDTGGVRTATTMALLLIDNGTARAYNIGDSRIYLYRDRQLIKLTRDHISSGGDRSFALSGAAVKDGGLTKYLGMPEEDGTPEPYRAKPFKVRRGDKLLICSDGLTDYVTDEDIAECLSKRKDPFGHTNELLNLAYREDSADNISVVVVEIVEPGIHITQNMILTAAVSAVLLIGLIAGGVFGYTMASRRLKENKFDVTADGQTGVTGLAEESVVSEGDVISYSTTAKASSSSHPTTTYPTTTHAPYLVETFTVTPLDFTLKVGGSYKLGVTLAPSDIPQDAIVWSSDNPEIATVDDYGLVTALSKGTATISASIDDWTQTVKVRVK